MTPEPLLRRLVGAILRERRESQGRTLRDVGVAARVSVAYLSEVERGRKEASSEVLLAVCTALGMRLVDLVAAAHDELLSRAQVVDLTGRPMSSARSASGAEPDARADLGSTLAAPQAVLRAA